MKQLILSLLFFNFCFIANSQQPEQFSYLIVSMERKVGDVEMYYRIIPEEGNPNSAGINALVKYSTRLKNEGRAIFYPSKMDTANVIFNYFKSISSALEYLDAQGWRLFTITNDVNGSGGSTSTHTYYYLRKESN